ncbi:Tn3 family transposase [Streptomyces decoyicus]|uniref:Tn3 family transposase n=1 Tax=Streptomyces decoyicus TaxID=249567 RepID=UPI00363E3A24
MCAVLLSESCNVGLTPVMKPDVPALTRGRLVQVGQGYFRAENIWRRTACSSSHRRRSTSYGRAAAWSLPPKASGSRSPCRPCTQVRTPVTRPAAQGGHLAERGSDQVMGLGAVVVPGTLRDSLFILDAIHARDGGPKPETAITAAPAAIGQLAALALPRLLHPLGQEDFLSRPRVFDRGHLTTAFDPGTHRPGDHAFRPTREFHTQTGPRAT